MWLTTGCITPFTPDIAIDHDGLLVVEGIIVDGETVVNLNWSEGFSSEKTADGEPRFVEGATVRIEGEDGARFELADEGGGKYRSQAVTLDGDTRYRLFISNGVEQYASEWRAPQPTPPVENIKLSGENGMVQVLIDVKGEPGGPRHYFWNYEETWETNADAMAINYFGLFEGDFRGYSLGEYEKNRGSLDYYTYPNLTSPFYYCWKFGRSRQLLLESTDLLTQNSLRDHVLYEFPSSDDRLSVLYHTKIRQYAIGEQAYHYFDNLKSNTDETGSIFAPIPSEMEGNIECLTSPDVPVIGYVEVSRQVEYEAFFPREESPYTPPRSTCEMYTLSELNQMMFDLDDFQRNLALAYYPFVIIPDPITRSVGEYSIFALRECIDCRRKGGSKLRPSWWPNNHF
jgi:hypothetical protein